MGVRGPPLDSQGEGRSIFETNNFGRTLREINSRTVPYKHVTKCEIFSAPPSPVEINNLPATNTSAPPPPNNGGPLAMHWFLYPSFPSCMISSLIICYCLFCCIRCVGRLFTPFFPLELFHHLFFIVMYMIHIIMLYWHNWCSDIRLCCMAE